MRTDIVLGTYLNPGSIVTNGTDYAIVYGGRAYILDGNASFSVSPAVDEVLKHTDDNGDQWLVYLLAGKLMIDRVISGVLYQRQGERLIGPAIPTSSVDDPTWDMLGTWDSLGTWDNLI